MSSTTTLAPAAPPKRYIVRTREHTGIPSIDVIGPENLFETVRSFVGDNHLGYHEIEIYQLQGRKIILVGTGSQIELNQEDQE